MIKLLKYLKDYKTESVLGPLFKLLEALFELFVPLVIVKLIDVGIANQDRAYIAKSVGLLALLALIGLTFSVIAQYFAAKASVGFAKKIRRALYAHVQTFSYTELDTLTPSTLITRMTSDINQVQTGVNITLRLLLRSPFVVFGAMIMAFTIDVRSALIFAAAIPILSVVVFSIMLVSIPLYKKVQAKLDIVLRRVRENLTGVRVLRAFCKEYEETEKFLEENQSLTAMQLHTGRISALMNPLTYVLINLAVVILIYRGALSVSQGLLTQGAVVALYNYMSQILVELIKMANMIITLTKAAACGNRIEAVLETETSEDLSQKSDIRSDGSVQLQHVSFRYQGASEDSLSDISFSAESGEIIGIIGGTGSGKSTLVQLIPAFYPATAGMVLVGGKNVNDYSKDVLRQKIGIVPQKAVLFRGTLRDNLKWGNESAEDDALWEALRLAQAEQIVRDKGGLDFLIEQNGRNLSGGQKQRITIARALVRKPQILILDDSSSALDFATDAALRKALGSLSFAPTIFVVSQRVSALAHADRILVLDDGCAAGLGTHEELLKSCPIYQEIAASQTGGENK